MLKLTLKDSCMNGVCLNFVNYKNINSYTKAIDSLNKQFDHKTVRCIRIGNYGKADVEGHLIDYEITDYTTLYGNLVPNKCKFSTSYYIGSFMIDNVSITIIPRYGKLFAYMLNYASNLFIPHGQSGFENSQTNNFFLLILLWKAMLNKALTDSQIPKGYIEVTRNERHYKGRLSIQKHIRTNLVDQSQFFCRYRKLSLNNTINRTIRYTYSLLKAVDSSSLLDEFTPYDLKLEAFGVSKEAVPINEIDTIQFTRINAPYRPLINLCRSIISCKSKNIGSGTNENLSYFVNMADLWEWYLLKVLQRNLPDEYHVYSPNSSGGEYLLADEMRAIRPDILIEREGQIVMIIDAKYKQYTRIGETAQAGVSRDDLYQMNTYLYHYGYNRPLVGVFTSPIATYEEKMHTYTSPMNHKIGIVNLGIDKAGEDLEAIHREEVNYSNKILRLLRE